MAFYPKKRRIRRRAPKRKTTRKVSKPLARAVKSVMLRQVETKSIVAPHSGSTVVNTVNVAYNAGSGLLYLIQDMFKMPQGTEDSTGVYAANRIGDKINSIGFLMDYYFSLPPTYTVSAGFYLPYVKFRVTVFTSSYGVPPPSQALLYDQNILSTNTSTLQPINWGAGFVKSVLYDKVFVIRNQTYTATTGSPNLPILTNVFHFKKYIKYARNIRYTDNSGSSPNTTDKPIYVSISAEVDDSNSMTPTGTTLMRVTGYSRGWFKDA